MTYSIEVSDYCVLLYPRHLRSILEITPANYEISGSHSGRYEDDILLGYSFM
jgi:hypothetical protein